MRSRLGVAIACASVVGIADVADGMIAKTKVFPIDGSWQARVTVVSVKNIKDAQVGQQFVRAWTIKTRCARQCITTLSYRTTGGKSIKVTLHGTRKVSGTAKDQVFDCTDGGTAIGSLTFKLHVTAFVKHKKKRYASEMTGTGTQSGKGCASVKEVATLKVRRTGF